MTGDAYVQSQLWGQDRSTPWSAASLSSTRSVDKSHRRACQSGSCPIPPRDASSAFGSALSKRKAKAYQSRSNGGGNENSSSVAATGRIPPCPCESWKAWAVGNWPMFWPRGGSGRRQENLAERTVECRAATILQVGHVHRLRATGADPQWHHLLPDPPRYQQHYQGDLPRQRTDLLPVPGPQRPAPGRSLHGHPRMNPGTQKKLTNPGR
jgi:hypothetical protein